MATTKLWTVEDVERLPDDEFRYALIRGELFRMPPPKARHGLVTNTVGRVLGNYAVEHRAGVVFNQSGFVFARNPDTLLEPDVAFVQAARVPADVDSYPDIPPDLVVEVVPPSQTGPSIEEKTALYLAAGVRLVWVVDPVRCTVRVHRADGTEQLLLSEDVIDGEDVLPGFHVPVARLFD